MNARCKCGGEYIAILVDIRTGRELLICEHQTHVTLRLTLAQLGVQRQWWVCMGCVTLQSAQSRCEACGTPRPAQPPS